MTEIGDRWYSRPGIWFWLVIALGAAFRFYLVVFTDGTQDVTIWERHAGDVRDHGLIGYYHGDPWANHPPFISKVESLFLLAAAVALGVSLWIKLPTVLAIPALVLFIPDWRRRVQFLLIAGVVALATYVPALIQDPAIVWKNVFGYRAQILHTTAGVPAGGPRLLLFSIIAAPQNWPETFHAPILFLLANSWLIAVALAFFVVWLRRSSLTIPQLS